MISRVIKCWIWLANGLLVLPMMTRWMHGRHTDWYTYKAARDHSCISCLIKQFVFKREGKMMAWCVFFNKLSLSQFNILGPYRGHHVLVASFCCCQHAQAKHPLGLSLSFFIILFFPLSLYLLSHLLTLSHIHPILILTSFFFHLRDESLPTALFTPPEAAQMR